MIQWGYSGSGAMTWNLISRGAPWEITGVASGRAVSGSGFNAQLIIWDWVASTDQQFYAFQTSGWPGYYTLQDTTNGYVWNVSGNSTSYGAAIIEWSNDGSQNEQWQFRQGQVSH